MILIVHPTVAESTTEQDLDQEFVPITKNAEEEVVVQLEVPLLVSVSVAVL